MDLHMVLLINAAFFLLLIGFLMAWEERGVFAYMAPAEGGMICMTEKWDRMKVTHGGGQRKKETNEETHLSIHI